MPDPLRHVRALTERFGARVAASPEEAGAARYIAEAARAYTHQVWMEPFGTFVSAGVSQLLILGASLAAGLLLFADFRPAAVVGTLAAAAAAGQFLGWLELGWLFRRRESRNVVAVVPAIRAIRRRLVLVAHYDSPCGTAPPAWLERLSLGGVFLLALLAVLAAATGDSIWARAALVPGGIVAWGLVARSLGEMRGMAPAGEGGAAGPGLALAAGEALAQAPLRHTEVWTVYTGSKEPGMVGLQVLLERYGALLADADFVVLDRIGSGAPVYTVSEGAFPVRFCDADLVGYLAELGALSPDLHLTGADLPGYHTQCSRLMEAGFRAVSLRTAGDGRPSPRSLHDLVRLLRALGELIDHDAGAEAEAEGAGM
ncbi:MAG TPA: hypothetical protein VD973_11520 [Symbiobacteriaceae bacterium]|nr:hypothetical protein [Symbiobacteriaceae bacterium]